MLSLVVCWVLFVASMLFVVFHVVCCLLVVVCCLLVVAVTVAVVFFVVAVVPVFVLHFVAFAFDVGSLLLKIRFEFR